MKIVAISDTHSMHDKLDIPGGDILIHAGDFSNSGSDMDAVKFLDWIDNQDFAEIIIVAGNHDFFPFNYGKIFKEEVATMPHVHYLEDSGVTINGLKFWGTPWTLKFMNWAFMRPEENMKTVCDAIPTDTDILVTHGPVFGYLDSFDVRRPPNYEEEHLGSRTLLDAVARVQPRHVIHGHIHDGYGKAKLGYTKIHNVSICDEKYNPCNKVTIINEK